MSEPTTEQIEAAAKALRDGDANRVDTWKVPEWENLTHGFKIEYRRKARAALVAAAGAAPQGDSLNDAAEALRANAREIEDAQLAAHGMIDPITNAVIAGIKQSAAMVCELAGSQVSAAAQVQVDEAKHFHIWSDLACKPGECRMAATGADGFAKTRSAADANTDRQSRHRRLIEELRSAPIEGHAWRSLLERAADALAATGTKPEYDYGKKLAYFDGCERGDLLGDGYCVERLSADQMRSGRKPDMRRRAPGAWEPIKGAAE